MSKRVAGRTRDLVILIDKFIYILAKHWLFAINWAVMIYVGLPILAPILMRAGYEGLAGWIYRVYGPPTCHQLPERSYFFGGPSYVYSLEELAKHLGGEVPQRFVGDLSLGFKVALCQRCVAIYLTILIAGIAFASVRRWLRPLPWKGVLLFLLPLFLDGGGQLIGFWESTWLTRTLSGVSASIGAVWLVYPFLEAGMNDVRRTVAQQLHLSETGSPGDSRAAGNECQEEGSEHAQDQEHVELV